MSTQRRAGPPENHDHEQRSAGLPSLLGQLCTFPIRAGVDVAVDLGLAATLAVGGAMLRLAGPGLAVRQGTQAGDGQSQDGQPQDGQPGMSETECSWSKPAVPRSRRSMVVTADDGTGLHVEVDGDPGAPVTVVLCHGYALTGESWGFQRQSLRGTARVVVWDHRGHGRSASGRPENSTISQLGSDLFAVVRHVVPEGPIVLVGHSMGGMAILALAGQHPELFGDRVVGVGLLSTAAGPVSGNLGLPSYVVSAAERMLPGVLSALHPKRPLTRWAAHDLAMLLTRRYAFASQVPARLLEFLAEMIQSTPVDTLAEFLPQFRAHDGTAALPVLERVKTLIMVGDSDLLTPVEDSRAIVDAVPGAEFVVAGEAGHAVILERSQLVSSHLLDLLPETRPEQAS